MARTVKPEEFAAKRGAILDAAQRLVLTKGYEQMSLQDVLSELNISGGAFHHYFDSRAALLEALIERIRQESEKPLLPILHDPTLTAIQKLQGFFDTLDRMRIERKHAVIALGRVWYTDANAVVRQKVDEAVREQRAPLLTEIVRQGIREGVFTTALPDQSGDVLVSLLQGMGNAHARMLFAFVEQRSAEEIVATHHAYMDAIERVLGAPANAFYRADAEAVKVWLNALKEEA